jgi:hypothetical protein
MVLGTSMTGRRAPVVGVEAPAGSGVGELSGVEVAVGVSVFAGVRVLVAVAVTVGV